MKLHCPSCETELPGYANFCKYCGHALDTTTTIIAGRKPRGLPPVNVEPLDAPAVGSHVSIPGHNKVLGKLPLPVQRVISAVLTRARDPQPEEPHTRPEEAAFQSLAWGRLPLLALISTLGVFSVAYAYTGARNGAAGAEIFFWLGLLLIFVPAASRLISPGASRLERIGLLCIVVIYFFLLRVMISPFYFSTIDGFMHWRSAENIATNGHLFGENTLLPVSPFYPGLEIVTNALSRLSGLDDLNAGFIVVGVAHLVAVLSLFMLYEQITKSARIAGIAMILYIANPHFLFYDTEFAYGSLALPLATFVLFAMARHETLSSDRHWMTFTAWIALGAVAVTHHVTDFALDALLILWLVTYGFQGPTRLWRSNLTKTALFGVFTSLAWISLKGNPVVDYLSSYFAGALNELGQVLTGTSSARHLFVDYSGQQTPFWERLLSISSVALILLCLPFGLLCLWQRYRYNVLAYTLGIASLFYPFSYVFQFTNNGSEISDRVVAFLFIPIACVLAIFITQFWPTRWLNWRQTSLITCAVSVIFLGGVILENGPPWEHLPGPYLVAAGERSIEPEGIQAAIWARSYLGSNNRVATDLTNGLLMSTYGDQRQVTGIEDRIDVTSVFFSPILGPNEVTTLQRAKVRYLVVDLRLSRSLPQIGLYFEQGEDDAFQHTTPISREALTKFNTIPQVNCVFDSGDIVIYDVGGLTNAPAL